MLKHIPGLVALYGGKYSPAGDQGNRAAETTVPMGVVALFGVDEEKKRLYIHRLKNTLQGRMKLAWKTIE